MDRAAIEGLYRRYGPMVLRRARSILGNEQEAQEAMQEVFIRAIEAGNRFRGDASPMTWLYTVTTNHCLNAKRNRARQGELLEECSPDRVMSSNVGSSARSIEDRSMVSRLLGRIPDELGRIAICYYIDEMNQEEIAALLGVSRRYVRDRLEAFLIVARGLVTKP